MKLIAQFLDFLYQNYEHADSNQCWNWNKVNKGWDRGRMTFRGKIENASRVSYMEFKGEIPSDKKVLHDCVNSRCVNPNHLYLGTDKDNVRDSFEKGKVIYIEGKAFRKRRFFKSKF